jgi:regulator of sigma E protease
MALAMSMILALGFKPDTLLYILQFVVGLGVVVFVHEFGHFIAAKWAGIKVEEFALGFGKRLWGFKRGGTDYRINLVPLGGYIKMLGQDDLRPGAVSDLPGSWQATPIGKRIVVLTAGVFMNVVFGLLVFVAVYMAGIRFVAPVVGGVAQDMPAAQVDVPPEVARATGGENPSKGLRPGDRILQINGKHIRKFDQIRQLAGLSSADDTFDVLVERQVKGQTFNFIVSMKPKQYDEDGSKIYAFGMRLPITNVVREPSELGYLGEERILDYDRVVELAGQPVAHGWDIEAISQPLTGNSTQLVVERKGQRVTIPVTVSVASDLSGLEKEQIETANPLTILGMNSRMMVAAVGPDTPANKAGMKSGDVIVGLGDAVNPSRARINQVAQDQADHDLPIRLLRNGQIVETVVRPAKPRNSDRAILGFVPEPEQCPPVVSEVAENSLAAQAGIPVGVTLQAVNDTPVTCWNEVLAQLQKSLGQPVSIAYTLDGAKQTAQLGPLTPEQLNLKAYLRFVPAVHFSGMEIMQTDPIKGNPVQALAWGLGDTGDFIVTTYQTLGALFTRRVPFDQLRSIVGIGDVAVKIARKDFVQWVYFFGMISAVIAVFNFLPIPPLDGGHVAFAIAEKIRGKPLPLKLIMGFQYAGWIFFLLLFVLLTFQDVWRIITGG